MVMWCKKKTDIIFLKYLIVSFLFKSNLIPNDSNKSKLPDFEVTDLFPCFAIFTLQA